MKYQKEESVWKGGVPHQVSEYSAMKYLYSVDAEAKEWAASHSDELEAMERSVSMSGLLAYCCFFLSWCFSKADAGPPRLFANCKIP